MANNEVKLIISGDSTGAITGLQKAGDATKKFGNDTESMVSKLKSNWIGATAAITAATLAISKGWDLVDKAAKYEEQMLAMNRFAATYNTTPGQIVEDLQRIMNGQISMAAAADTASKAMALGIVPDQLKEIAKYADAVGDSLGIGTKAAFDLMANAAEKGTEKVLKTVVGVQDLDAAIGKSTETMSNQEKQQAMVALMLDKLKEKYGDVQGSVETTGDKMEQLTASMEDMQLMMGQALTRAAFAAAAVFNVLAATALAVSSAFWKIVEVATRIAAAFTFGDAKAKMMEFAEFAQRASNIASQMADKQGKNFSKNFDAATASVNDFKTAGEKMKPVVEVNQKALDKAAENAKKVKEALRGWADKMEEMNPTLSEHEKAVLKIWNDYEQLKQKLIELKAPAEALAEAQAIVFKMLDYQVALKQAKEYIEVKKIEKTLLTDQLDSLKSWRESVVDAYDGAIEAAKKYATELQTIDNLLARGKEFLAGGPDKSIDKQKDALKDMADKAWKSNDVGQMSAAMQALENFINMNKNIDTSTQKDIYADLLWKLDRMKTSREVSLSAAETSANALLKQIASIDEQIYALQEKLAKIEVIINTDPGKLAVEMLRKQIDTLLPDNMVKTITVKTVLHGLDNSGLVEVPADVPVEDSYASGTSYVPRTGIYRLHQGEAVIPASQNTTKNNTSLTLAPVFNISGGGDPEALAKGLDAVFARMFKEGTSQLQHQMKQRRN